MIYLLVLHIKHMQANALSVAGQLPSTLYLQVPPTILKFHKRQ